MRSSGLRMCAMAALVGCGSLSARSLTFTGTTDRNPLEYAVGELIRFTVTLVDRDNGNATVAGQELRWACTGDDGATSSGTATSDTPLVVTASLARPGFVRLTVNVYTNGVKLAEKTEKFVGSAGAGVADIPEYAPPADFGSFWTNAVSTLYATAFTTNSFTPYTPSAADPDIDYWTFSLSTFAGERPATGIVAMPRTRVAKELGIVACFNGYGFGATPTPSASIVKQGNIVLQMARHGEDPANADAGYYTALQNGEMKNFCFRGNDGAVQETDFYKMLMRDLRALQFVKGFPEWNGTALKTTGGSMGGYQALSCAALESAATACEVSIPWCADLSGGVKHGRMTGWRPDWTETLGYVDLKNMARLVRCPVTIVTAGLGDYVCPPSGESILYRNLPRPKSIRYVQNHGHDGQYGVNAPTYLFSSAASEPDRLVAAQRTLVWKGEGATKDWSSLGNWRDSVGGTNAIPRNGDELTISVNPGSSCKNDIPGLRPYQLRLAGYQSQNPFGEAVVFSAAESAGIYNQGYLHYDLPTKLIGTNVTVYSSSTMVCRNWFASGDGAYCGIVKTGSGGMYINGSNASSMPTASDFAGFKYIEIAEGTFGFGFNGSQNMSCLPSGMTLTFAAQDTRFLIRDACTLKDFTIRETGTAVGRAHRICSQHDDNGSAWYAGCLQITGTPAVNPMTFTGAIVDLVDFTWNPDSAAQTFVFDGGKNTTTGCLTVAKGTVKLTGGATFTQLMKLRLSGGADTAFTVETAPATAFHAAELDFATGNEAFTLAAGVTVTVGAVNVDGVRIAPGVYGAGGTAAAWLKGAGTVVVEGRSGVTLVWAKLAMYGNLNWNNPVNWVNPVTGTNDVPFDGDTIYLPGRSGYDAGGTAGRTDSTWNNIVDFRPRRIYVQSGYSCPGGNPVIFDGDNPSDGIYNSGFMYYRVPTVVNTDVITLSTPGGNVGHRADIYSTDGHRFKVIKTGNGLFGLQNSGGNRYTGFRYLEIAEGRFSFSWQGFGVGTAFPQGLEATYTAAGTYLQCSVDTTLRDFVLRESSAAANKAHYLGTQNKEVVTLTVTGKPAADSLFTGVLQDPLSFAWAVDDRDRTFVFSGVSSSNLTTRTLTVSGGTVRLADGATFTQLGTLALTGGSNACFAVDMPPATAFSAQALELATGAETLHLAGGVKIAVAALTVNGTSMPAGVYCGVTGVGGVTVPWISGGGNLCVGGADHEPPIESEPESAASWTANGGADMTLGNGSNWGEAGNTDLPDLTGGSLVATFAAGTGAALDRNAVFRGIALDAPGAWTFANTDATRFAALGSGGLATSGKGRVYTLGWPFMLFGPQTWDIGAGDTVNVTAPLAGGADRLAFTGTGTVNLDTAIGFAGALVLSNGVVNVNADDGLGASAAAPVEVDLAKTKLYLNGVTVNRTIKNISSTSYDNGLYVKAGTTNVLNGDLDMTQPFGGRLNMGDGSLLRIKGRVMRKTTNWQYFGGGSSAAKRATIHLDGPLDIVGGSAFAVYGNLDLYFNAVSNDLGNVWFWFNQPNNRMYTTVPYAFAKTDRSGAARNAINAWGATSSVWDLCGNDQELAALGSTSGLTVTSERPATLHLVSNGHNYTWEGTNRCAFAGAASFSFEGGHWTRLEGLSTSTGRVEVTKGRLELTETASWTNAAAAVVKGGELKVMNSEVFGRATVVRFEGTGGRMNLAYAGCLRVGALTYDGETQRDGTYGSSSSSAQHRDDTRFSGTGLLAVVTVRSGSVLIFR